MLSSLIRSNFPTDEPTSAVKIDAGTVTLNNDAVFQNSIKRKNGESKIGGQGGAIYAIGSTNIVMNGGTLQNNISYQRGGAVYLGAGVAMTISDGIISGNRVEPVETAAYTYAALIYGGIYVNNASLNITGGTISGNTAALAGDGVYHTGKNGLGEVISAVSAIGGDANIEDDIYLSSDDTTYEYSKITSALKNNVKFTVAGAAEDRVIAEGNNYTLTNSDAAKIKVTNSDMALRLSDNQISLSNTARTYLVLFAYDANGGSTKLPLITEGISVTVGSAPPAWDGIPITITEDTTLYAIWAAVPSETFTITAAAETGGTVSGGGEVEEGGSITLTAAPNKNYKFDGWYDGETKVCDTAEFAVENVTADKTYTAKFVADSVIDPDPSAFDFTSLRTLRIQSVAVNHETKTIEINVETDADYITIYVYQLEAVPGGTFRMASYMGNKVVYNSAGSYRIYFISNPTVTVKANITIGDQTEQYTVNINFDMTKASFDFTNLRGENINSVTVEHDAKAIKVQSADDVDSIILYVSQHDAIYGGTLRMASYLGNKVTYASNGVYTVYSNGKENVSVKTNITINGVTEQYMINITFPVTAPNFSFNTLAGVGRESVAIDHDAGTIVINADNANTITLPIEQDEVFHGKLRMVSYLGNKVSFDQNTRVYTISRRDKSTIQVKVKVELGSDSKEYLMTINYMDMEWGFDTVNATNVSQVSVDHATQTVTMDVTEGFDHIVLYIDQECATGASQIWMKSYMGNDVVYNADDRTYTITRKDKDDITVAAKITILGETRYYDININFSSAE